MRGLRVGVTGARKAGELARALERQGADVLIGPLVSTDQPVDDDVIVAATDAITAASPAWVAASTGVGMRLWAEVAQRHGRLDDLRRTLSAARRVARGAKAVGGLTALGCRPEHVTEEETDDAVVAWLAERAGPGDTIAVQLHGGDTNAYDGLEESGAPVLRIRPYVAGLPPEHEEPARALVLAVAGRELDVVTFTSPGAARNLFELADGLGADVLDRVTSALRGDVAVAVIGPVTGEVFADRDVPVTVAPERHRQGQLVRAIARWAADGRPTAGP